MLTICGDTICKPLQFFKTREFLNKFLPLAFFHLNGKKATFSLVTKKAANKTLKITVQYLYFLSAEKFLEDSYLMKCLVFFWLTVS